MGELECRKPLTIIISFIVAPKYSVTYGVIIAIGENEFRSSAVENNPYQSPDSQQQTGQGDFQPVKVFAMNQRIGRVRYLAYSFMATLLMFVGLIVFGGILGALSSGGSPEAMIGVFFIIYAIFGIVSLFISAVLGVRRLHDLDKTGWLWLLFLVPIVNLGMMIYLLFFPGTEGENQYGKKPEPNTALTWVAGIIAPIAFVFIIGILAAIAIPAYQDYVERAQQAQMNSQ